MNELIKELEALKQYTVDTKSGKRKDAKCNKAIDRCIEVVRRHYETNSILQQ